MDEWIEWIDTMKHNVNRLAFNVQQSTAQVHSKEPQLSTPKGPNPSSVPCLFFSDGMRRLRQWFCVSASGHSCADAQS